MNSRADSQASFFSARGGVKKGSTIELDEGGNGGGDIHSKAKNNSGHKQRRATMSKGIVVPKFALNMINNLNENSSVQTTSSNFFSRIFDQFDQVEQKRQ